LLHPIPRASQPIATPASTSAAPMSTAHIVTSSRTVSTSKNRRSPPGAQSNYTSATRTVISCASSGARLMTSVSNCAKLCVLCVQETGKHKGRDSDLLRGPGDDVEGVGTAFDGVYHVAGEGVAADYADRKTSVSEVLDLAGAHHLSLTTNRNRHVHEVLFGRSRLRGRQLEQRDADRYRLVTHIKRGNDPVAVRQTKRHDLLPVERILAQTQIQLSNVAGTRA